MAPVNDNGKLRVRVRHRNVNIDMRWLIRRCTSSGDTEYVHVHFQCPAVRFSLSYKDISTAEATWENFNRDSRVNIDEKNIEAGGPKGLRPAGGSSIPTSYKAIDQSCRRDQHDRYCARDVTEPCCRKLST